MSKVDRHTRITADPSPHPAQPGRPLALWSAVLACLGLLVVIGYLTLVQMRAIRAVLDARLDQIDTRLAQLSTKVERAAAARPAAAPSSGPDPNRVYVVNTEGAPVAGPPLAAITIAEFSDFQ